MNLRINLALNLIKLQKFFLDKIKNAEIIFFFKKIIFFVSLTQKIFIKFLFNKNVIKFKINSLRSKSIDSELHDFFEM